VACSGRSPHPHLRVGSALARDQPAEHDTPAARARGARLLQLRAWLG
jgi:hypothetical protein